MTEADAANVLVAGVPLKLSSYLNIRLAVARLTR